jgi:DNA-binding response OmpR family regulator
MAQILLIEPNRVLGQTYHQALTHAGHKVQTCATAQAALLSADEFQPDIAIVELQLVSHSGIEFLYEFRSYPDWRDVPVLLHTHVPPTQFQMSDESLRSQLGVRHYLYKPRTSLRELLAAVTEHATVGV